MHKTPPNTTIEPAQKSGTAHVLFRDYELRGELRLDLVGPYRYCSDPATEILVAGYAVDDGPVRSWVPGDVVPAEAVEAAFNPDWRVVAHNDAFETQVEQQILSRRHSWPTPPPIERHRCTMAAALAAGLPGRLDKLADILELAHRKDAAGQRLMLQMARPRKPRQGEDGNGIFWFDDESRRNRLHSYNVQDVEIERELYGKLLPLFPQEQKLWELDACINDRGFPVDIALARAAQQVALAAGPEINAELAAITEGFVTSVNQIAKFQIWLQQHGCSPRSLDKKTVEALLENDELLPMARRALQLRLNGGQAAARKLSTLLATVGNDGRVRDAFKFHAAATGRWGGSRFQPQNLKKSKLEDVEGAIVAISTGSYEHVQKLYPQPLSVIADIRRSLICAAPRKILIGGDFSSIESRGLAWVAGEEWKLDSYRRFDATGDPRDEPYCATACKIFGQPIGTYTKDSPERNIGKTCDLAFGYAGGVHAFRKFSNQFTDEEVAQFNRDWRAAHSNIKKLWHRLDRAAWIAVQQRGRVVRCGVVTFKCTGTFLHLKLPSGRKLSYPQPRIIGDEHEQRVVFADNAAGQFQDCRHGHGAYGGLWTENVVSGIARDLLAEAMLRIEAAGYPIVIHVHDEIVAEVPEGFGSIDEFVHLMTCKPAWALDLPIAAKAWTGARYCK
jgi:DNA polymerase bacteriophage-type